MNRWSADRLYDAAIFSVIWLLLSSVVIVLSVGFAGGVREALQGYWISIRSGNPGILVLLAPILVAPGLLTLYVIRRKAKG